jgi:organic radical activating enzyme
MENPEIERLGQFLQNKHKLFQTAQLSMGLILTDHCPAACRHCVSDNLPGSVNGIPLEMLKKRVKKTIDLKKFKKIVITGGEPFYEFEKLHELVQFITANQYQVSVVTGAYWSSSYEKCNSQLDLLKKAGLNNIAISMDIYHQEKIPYRNIIHVLEACHQLDIPNTVVFTWSGNREKDHDLLDSFKSSLPDHLQKTLRITEGSMLLSGRALKNKLNSMHGRENEDDPVICQSMGKIIRSDGQVALCCGADLPENSPLLAGNIDTDSPKILKKSMGSNHLIPFIEIFGLRWMAERLEEVFAGFAIKADEMNTANRCNTCMKMFAEKRNSEFFAGLIREKDILDQIRGRYLLLYGHHFQAPDP